MTVFTNVSARLSETFFLLLGILGLAYFTSVGLKAAEARRSAQRFGAVHESVQPSPIGETMSAAQAENPDVMGRLTIPLLSLSVPIMSDSEATSLLRGIGHIPGTAMPGGLGTLGLAGHRDTFFRPLRRIAKGMDIQVADRTGTYHYRVDGTEIVAPEKVEVLAIGVRPSLTLITCYPFYFVGSAPKRFIVHAHLVSAMAD